MTERKRGPGRPRMTDADRARNASIKITDTDRATPRAPKTPARKRGGQPMTDASVRRSVRIVALCSEHEAGLLRRAAAKSGCSVSDLMRDGGLRDACEELGLDWDAWYHDHEERRAEAGARSAAAEENAT